MPVSVLYPQGVELEDGTTIQTTDGTWKKRRLVVETDRSEEEVRDMLSEEGFEETVMELPKAGRLGNGMIKRYKDWQVHVRLFRNGGNIQIDGEVEVSQKYGEHLTHGWLPAFDLCAKIVGRRFGGFFAYHKRYRQYVAYLDGERKLFLDDPKSKTSVVKVLMGVALAAIGVGLLAASSKK